MQAWPVHFIEQFEPEIQSKKMLRGGLAKSVKRGINTSGAVYHRKEITEKNVYRDGEREQENS